MPRTPTRMFMRSERESFILEEIPNGVQIFGKVIFSSFNHSHVRKRGVTVLKIAN